MANPPLTVFMAHLDAERLLELLHEGSVDVSVDDRDAGLRAEVRYAGSLACTVRWDPAYLEGDEGVTQRQGMAQYFAGFPGTEAAHADVERRIASFTQAVSVLATPDLQPPGDPRVALVFSIARAFDGCVFVPGALIGPHGAPLLEASRVADEPLAETLDDLDEPEPPTAERVARRALVLAAVATRSMMEMSQPQGAALEGPLAGLQGWAATLGLQDEAEPQEWERLHTPLGELTPQATVDGMWRFEGLGVLAWALGRFDLPRYDTLVDPETLLGAVGALDLGVAQTLVSGARLREADQLEAMGTQLLAVHWRLRDFSLSGRSIDFVEFADTCWFGPFDPSWAEVVDGDLALDGVPIARADPGVVQRCLSTAMERHLAIRWLQGGSAIYSETDTST